MQPLTDSNCAPVQHCLQAFSSSSFFAVSLLVTFDTQTFVVAPQILELTCPGRAEAELTLANNKIIETIFCKRVGKSCQKWKSKTIKNITRNIECHDKTTAGKTHY